MIKLQIDSEIVSQSLELDNGLIDFINAKIQNGHITDEGLRVGDLPQNDNDLDELQAREDALQTEYERLQREKEN